ncbi:MAG TPA: MIP family channel protein [Vicinamibacterales bacterium]|jgi:MIP family channel proteins|nr:MIP family channel protein [Vicinamibacterales bacterium]
MLRGTAREVAAEFLGTFVLIVFGVGVVAQFVLGGGANGQYLSVNLGWGLAVTMGIYVSAGISGAHLNPAVTLALALRRGFSWAKVGPYIAAQFAGAFLASVLVFITYREALDRFDGGVRQIGGALGTAGIWATYPQPFLSAFPGGIIDQIVGTALLVGVIFALSDARNFAPPERLTPVLVGLLVVLIGATFGYNAGYAINPARDLAPRLFTAMAGWGSGVFTAGNGWWWVPVVGPCIGGVLGGYVYDLVITRHHPPEAPVTPPPGRTSAGTDQQVALS